MGSRALKGVVTPRVACSRASSNSRIIAAVSGRGRDLRRDDEAATVLEFAALSEAEAVAVSTKALHVTDQSFCWSKAPAELALHL